MEGGLLSRKDIFITFALHQRGDRFPQLTFGTIFLSESGILISANGRSIQKLRLSLLLQIKSLAYKTDLFVKQSTNLYLRKSDRFDKTEHGTLLCKTSLLSTLCNVSLNIALVINGNALNLFLWTGCDSTQCDTVRNDPLETQWRRWSSRRSRLPLHLDRRGLNPGLARFPLDGYR